MCIFQVGIGFVSDASIEKKRFRVCSIANLFCLNLPRSFSHYISYLNFEKINRNKNVFISIVLETYTTIAVSNPQVWKQRTYSRTLISTVKEWIFGFWTKMFMKVKTWFCDNIHFLNILTFNQLYKNVCLWTTFIQICWNFSIFHVS